MWLPHSFIVLLFAIAASGALVNTTYDDSSSSFTFSAAWDVITPSNPCSGCSTKPNATKVHDGTWHDGNVVSSGGGPTGSFTFQGSAVYIFGIDQNSAEADIVFTLGDKQQTHHYDGPGTVTSSGTDQFVYNALFFSATGLPSDQTQTVSWVLNFADTGVGLQIGLFDYAVVTTGEDDVSNPPPTSSTTSVQTIQTSTPSSTNNNSPNTSIGSSRTTTRASSSSGASQSETSSGASHSSGASQINNPTVSGADQGSSPSGRVSGISGTTTVVAGIGATSSKSKSNIGAIAGGIVGALVIIALVALLVWYRLRRVRRVKPDTAVRPQSQFLRVADYPILARQAENAPRVSTSLSKAAMAEGASTVSLLRPQDDHSAGAPTAPSSNCAPSIMDPTDLHNSSSPDVIPTTTTTSRDMRWMEERLVALEAQMAAQVVQQQPPPYLHEDDE
ncbi:Myb-DNA-bind-2 domain-containing protein [Mycena sanguinolenta]|uniref:Myb-DNA-bind-2 domain-containing protein n=1 Tax=Mycena sanguinolenta TaxID=230812 RepID=A0A8H6YMA9_9AGAR|nr:Myb-DNA-bind-2 domain-containing protein [Mycena sanguinolenta]